MCFSCWETWPCQLSVWQGQGAGKALRNGFNGLPAMERDLERAGLEGSLPFSEPVGSRKGAVPNQTSATSEPAALWVCAVFRFHPLEKNAITQFSDSCSWKLQSLSQAGLQPWERGRRGHALRAQGGHCWSVWAAQHHLHPQNVTECQSVRVLHSLQCASWVKKQECRQGGNVGFRNLSPKCCPAECMSSSESCAAARCSPGRWAAVLFHGVMPKNSLFIVFNRYLTRCQRLRRRTRSCCYRARRARRRSRPRAASGR